MASWQGVNTCKENTISEGRQKQGNLDKIGFSILNKNGGEPFFFLP